MEKRGLPTAVVITEAFLATANATARLVGLPGYPFLVIPHPISRRSREELRAAADSISERVAKVLTS